MSKHETGTNTTLLDSLDATITKVFDFNRQHQIQIEEAQKERDNSSQETTDNGPQEISDNDEIEILHKMAYLRYEIQLALLRYEGLHIKHLLQRIVKNGIEIVLVAPSPSHFISYNRSKTHFSKETNGFYGWVVTFRVKSPDALSFAEESLPALIENRIGIPAENIRSQGSNKFVWFANDLYQDSNPNSMSDKEFEKRTEFNLMLPFLPANVMEKLAKKELKFEEIQPLPMEIERMVCLDHLSIFRYFPQNDNKSSSKEPKK